MKWPASITLIRHDTSEYNVLKEKKSKNKLYKKFLVAYNKNPDDSSTRKLAEDVKDKFALGVGDADTDLADKEGKKPNTVGRALAKKHVTPDVVFVSPYKRATLTYYYLSMTWNALQGVKMYKEERIRELEHGKALLYNDWCIFFALHPEQRKLYDIEGRYWYRWPQGENIPDVRLRNNIWINTLIREFSGKHVLVITHHLNILAMRANLERLDADEFIKLDEKEKPINCGVTLYEGMPKEGKDGRLKLKYYNKKLY